MKSALADYAEQQLIEAARLLTHEQRLAAFAEHSRLMFELYVAGEQQRHLAKSRKAELPS